VALLGIVRSGSAYLALDRAAPLTRQEELLRRARVRQIVVTNAAPAPAGAGAVETVRLPADPVTNWSADPDILPDTPAYLAFTSGTTGIPRGVIVAHRAVRRLVEAPVYCDIGAGDRVASLANPAFDATTFEVWATLAAGGTIVVLHDVTDMPLDDWLAVVAAERVHTMFLTTSLFHMVAAERPASLGILNTVLVGGEQLDIHATRAVLRAGPPRRLVNAYGPTETTTFATYQDCTLPLLADLDQVPVGTPIQSTSVHVLDADLRPVPAGARGELVICGPGVALGYLDDEQATSARFVTVPGIGDAYLSGDIASMTASGRIDLHGRRDRQIKLRGFRIELDEVELAVVRTGLATQAVVEKVGDGPGSALAGFVVPATEFDLDALRSRLAQTLPGYMVPTTWQMLSALPLGPTGKIDRAALLAALEPNTSDTSAFGDEVANTVISAWREVLPNSSSEVNFLEAGGNSITAVQLASRVQTALGVQCPPELVLLADDVADLVARVVEHQSASS
jgi:amino acid adenylation domain-containing protein